MTIFGSSNWTTPSANSQHEHNYFTTKIKYLQLVRELLRSALEQQQSVESGGDGAVCAVASRQTDLPDAGQRDGWAQCHGREARVGWRCLCAQLRHLRRHQPDAAAVCSEQEPRAGRSDQVAEAISERDVADARAGHNLLLADRLEDDGEVRRRQGRSAASPLAGTPPASNLPSPWADRDIGSVPVAGSAQYSNGNVHRDGFGRRRVGDGRRVPLRVSHARRERVRFRRASPACSRQTAGRRPA